MAQNIDTMPLRGRDYWIVAVSSMEQIIGAMLSTIVGIMLPMIQLVHHPGLPSFAQGVIGSCGLIGIAIGSVIFGRLGDAKGYLLPFRLCPIIIMAGAVICWLGDSVGALVAAMLVMGIGTGGGYSLDSSYISELMPAKWRSTMVGLAKASCAFGFIGAAVISWAILKRWPEPLLWNRLALILGGMGAVTLLMRIAWWESPQWLMDHGRTAEAQRAAEHFLGPDAAVPAPAKTDAPAAKTVGMGDLFHGQNLSRVIFSGIPWACEGLGVYGFGVFLPVLVMALGIDKTGAVGMAKVINSVELTGVVNSFILPGFIIGLLLMNRVNRVKLMTWGFYGAAAGLVLLLAAVLLKLPGWVMIVGFMVFEVMLNAGPHLLTFVIPSIIYPVNERAAGAGIAAMLGKVGAVVGVIVMPILLEWGGMTLVLIVSAAVMLAGALIGSIYGRKLKLD